MPPIAIRRAEASDAAPLTDLMKASGAYAGAYASILEDYAITVAQVAADQMFVATIDGDLAGFYSLTTANDPELDLMFVADDRQGQGVGMALFAHMQAQARLCRVAAIRIVSHPPSANFYRRMGAIDIGMKAPTPTARWERPILLFKV